MADTNRMNARLNRSRRGRRGNATMIALTAVTVLGGMSFGILALSLSAKSETEESAQSIRALFAAQAGVSDAVEQLVAAEALDADEREDLEDVMASSGCGHGSASDPISMEQSSYWSSTTAVGGDRYTVLSTGSAGGVARSLEVVVQRDGSRIFDNALFAGNSSGDPDYVLELGGNGGQADEVEGDVYSGGGVDVGGDATVAGAVRAHGVVTPMGAGDEGIQQSIPDIAGMDYAANADFDVASLFAAATYHSDDAGGSAWQLPEASPAHIFRKNPSDRTDVTSGTAKDDYFLEDPYERVSADNNMNGNDAYRITLSGSGGEPGPVGNEKVYFIDGNLWVHNLKTFSFKIVANGEPATKIVFVVKGNVYFSDNIFYNNRSNDGVAFIAMRDEAVEDSGNIYFGDPTFGTLEEMNAFMYAENNFYDTNLDAAGSAEVTVHGTMSAGNQVLIERDYGSNHSKLTVEFDDRIVSGALVMPMLPSSTLGAASFSVVSWREVPND